MILNRLILSAFGLGFLLKMPGTWGSLGGLLVVFLVPKVFLLLLFPSLMIVGTILIHRMVLTNSLENDDPSWIVLDEVVGQIIPFLFFEATLQNLILGFLLFRFFDILKPWPISKIESIFAQKPKTWALGIMLDDVVAGLFATLVMIIFYYFY